MSRAIFLLIIFGVTLVSYLAAIGVGRILARRGHPGLAWLREKGRYAADPVSRWLHVWSRKPKERCVRRGSELGVTLLIFANNLVLGALVTKTLYGVIFIIPYLTTVWAGLVQGTLMYRPKQKGHNLLDAVVFLEFGGYVVAAAGGINLGLSLIFSLLQRSMDPLILAVRELGPIYAVVAVMLLAGAFLEGRVFMGMMRRLPDSVRAKFEFPSEEWMAERVKGLGRDRERSSPN